MLLRTVEKMSDKSGEVNNISEEGVKQVGERVEEDATAVGKIEERQECILKEIEVHLSLRL